ncbi:MAG: hypothetical protein JWN03_5519 [Nocardia sp.]|uniref:TetR/AcrR family transcriptional regulator n=1 Tax=Nocardia sp. TaxID=1821 RepID=UPI00260D9736|nr:TetR family transcriptional regulator [Nocardia sp.]MCU1645244.1 hypothetical protein [Nocardia sp.]
MTDTGATTRAEQARQTRQRIIDTARSMFSERGYEATTLQQIADEMGLTKAAVYYYFRTKAEIFREIVVPEFRAMNELLDRAETVRSRPKRVQLVIAGMVDMLVAQREALAILQANPAIDVRIDSDNGSFESMRDRALVVLYGDNPSPDQRAALYINIAIAVAVPALADIPDDILRETLTRACTRLFNVK